MIESLDSLMLNALGANLELPGVRWVMQIALLSLGLTLAQRFTFTADSSSRRSLGVAAVWILALVPAVLLIWQPRYQIGVSQRPEFLPWVDLNGLPLLLVAVWLLLASFMCVSMLVCVYRARRNISRLPLYSSSAAGSDLGQLNETFAHRLNIAAPVIVSGQRCCASSLGENCIVVPQDFGEWPTSAQRSVIAHELVHLARQDDRLMIALQLLARCYLFCPWLHLLYRWFVAALEEACDERAAELVGSRSVYLEGLAEAALREGSGSFDRGDSETANASRSAGHGPVAALISADHKHSFMQRLARLLEKQQFFEVQSGALMAGLSFGLLSLAVLTTFEFVEVPKSYQGKRLSIADATFQSRIARPLYTGPEVITTSSLPNEFSSGGERVSPAVIYPGRALLDAVEGEVVVEFSIAADGSTARPKILHSSHPTYFDKAATRAVRQTVYHTRYSNVYENNERTDLSGVSVAIDPTRTGRLQAVGSKQSNRAQKQFLFRLNASE